MKPYILSDNVSSEEHAASSSASNLLIMEAARSSETFEMSLKLHGDIPQNTDLSVLCHTAIGLRKMTFEYEALNLKSGTTTFPCKATNCRIVENLYPLTASKV
jgi:hypothetical protein